MGPRMVLTSEWLPWIWDMQGGQADAEFANKQATRRSVANRERGLAACGGLPSKITSRLGLIATDRTISFSSFHTVKSPAQSISHAGIGYQTTDRLSRS